MVLALGKATIETRPPVLTFFSLIHAEVPADARTGHVSVVHPWYRAQSPSLFYVTPRIASSLPSRGPIVVHAHPRRQLVVAVLVEEERKPASVIRRAPHAILRADTASSFPRTQLMCRMT